MEAPGKVLHMISRPLQALALALLACGCQLTPSLVVTPRLGMLDVGGDVFVSSSNASVATDADDLGFDDDGSVFEPRVDFSWGPAHVMGTVYSASYEGTGTAEGQLDLGTVTINAGDQVESVLDVTSVNLVTTFDLIPTELVDLGIGLGVRVIDFDGKVTSLSTSESIASNETFALPVAAARAAVGIGPFELSLVGSGLAGSYDGIEASVLDLDLMGEYTFEEFLGFHGALVLGYRYISVAVDYTDSGSDVDADLDFQGPYIGLSLGI